MQTLLTIEQALALAAVLNGSVAADSAPTKSQAEPERKVIVRAVSAGAVYGTIVSRNDTTVHLKNARQMWSWTAAEGGTLMDCATHGVKAGKFSAVTNAVTVLGACAIIDVAEKAVSSLESAKWG